MWDMFGIELYSLDTCVICRVFDMNLYMDIDYRSNQSEAGESVGDGLEN